MARIYCSILTGRQQVNVWHCHILSHEEHEMMRPLLLTPKPSLGVTAPVIANAPSTIAPAATNPLNSALTPLFATNPIAV